jgi:hypothetical protein
MSTWELETLEQATAAKVESARELETIHEHQRQHHLLFPKRCSPSAVPQALFPKRDLISYMNPKRKAQGSRWALVTPYLDVIHGKKQ